jgi:Uncharacterized protein conserved in bacteria (DUF2263)
MTPSSLTQFFSSTQQPPNFAHRKKVAADTKARSNAITLEHAKEGATTESMFLTADQLLPLDVSNCPKHPSCRVKVVNADSFTAARDIMKVYPEAQGKTAVLNLASDEVPGGGWEISLATTQVRPLIYLLLCVLRHGHVGRSPLLFLDPVRNAET